MLVVDEADLDSAAGIEQLLSDADAVNFDLPIDGSTGQPVSVAGRLERVRFYLTGADALDVQVQCLRLGQSRNLLFVRSVTLNGRKYYGTNHGGIFTIAQACALISQNAR